MSDKTKDQVSQEEIWNMENYLKSYKICKRILQLKNYEDKYFETLEWESETPAEFGIIRAKMFEVRHFIMGMPNSTEKVLLYYHFVRCEPIERCAELLGISRSSGFRLKRNALIKAHLYSLRIGAVPAPFGF